MACTLNRELKSPKKFIQIVYTVSPYSHYYCQPSLGNSSCASPDAKSFKLSGQKKVRKHEADPEESFMEVEADNDYDFIPGTPPHKKVILVCMWFPVIALYLSFKSHGIH